ncbi:uncharacterized protein LOC143078283 isoform X1 [Mytilus galloprovincialis]|uniref:uncharacterized protein LOC143078283 isoform X1 n=1 Tax=Mytilus galloprovincialis TaxID=29158 RepID=UPI003F7C1D59
MSILLLISLLGLFGAVLGLHCPTNISKKDFEKTRTALKSLESYLSNTVSTLKGQINTIHAKVKQLDKDMLSIPTDDSKDCQEPIIKTPNLYKYIPLTDNGIAMGNPVRQSIRFKVKANNDAHVALMSSNNPNDPLYEIVLGGWGNTQSVIRDRKQGGQLAVYRGRVLNSHEFRTFTIKWSNARIRVEDESGKKLMEWTDTTNPYTIRNIGISTGWGSTGIWSFPCQDCQEPIIKTPNLYKYIPLTDNGIDMGNPVRQSIRFKVKANNDAHVALMSSNNPNDPLYEIVLGGWGNKQSVIRDRKQGGQLAVYRGRVLNSNEFRTFTIKWSNARIRVEDESGKKLIEWTDTTNPYTIRNIGISTGWGSTGIWSFPCQDCQGPIIKTPNLYKYIPLTDNGIAMGNPVRQSIRFKVKANNDAHVALMSSNTPNDPLYEIVLGSWGNKQSVIRDRKQGGQLAVYRGRVLNSNEFRTFTIKWSNARIRVEDESGKKLMEWTDTTNPYTIRNIGISTGWGSTGIWSFPCQASDSE